MLIWVEHENNFITLGPGFILSLWVIHRHLHIEKIYKIFNPFIIIPARLYLCWKRELDTLLWKAMQSE